MSVLTTACLSAYSQLKWLRLLVMDASGYAIVERAPEQLGPSRNVCTKVPTVQDDLDTSVDDRPNMGSKPGPRGATC